MAPTALAVSSLVGQYIGADGYVATLSKYAFSFWRWFPSSFFMIPATIGSITLRRPPASTRRRTKGLNLALHREVVAVGDCDALSLGADLEGVSRVGSR